MSCEYCTGLKHEEESWMQEDCKEFETYEMVKCHIEKWSDYDEEKCDFIHGYNSVFMCVGDEFFEIKFCPFCGTKVIQ